MKKLSFYTGGHPLRIDDLTLLQAANLEGTKAMLDGICYGYTTTGVYLSGASITPSGPTFAVTAGYVYWNGEIYPIDAQTFPTLSVGQTWYWQIQQEVLSPSPVTYRDLTVHNVHIREKAVVVAASSAPVNGFQLSKVLWLQQIVGAPKYSVVAYWGPITHFTGGGEGIYGTPAFGYALCDGGTSTLVTGGTYTRPDFKGRTLVGYDSAQSEFDSLDGSSRTNETGGEKTHTLTKSEIPKHKHTVTTGLVDGGQITVGNASPDFMSTAGSLIGISGSNYSADTFAHSHSVSGSTGDGTTDGLGGQAHNNLQPYHTVLWMIKLY